jgi:PAS domain S-box-containing protein
MEPKKSILIVEDDLHSRKILEHLLNQPEYIVHSVETGPEALQTAVELKPDLILLDVLLPGMDGFEVCRRLRANPKVAEVPIIMVTALGDNKSRMEAMQAGADDYVTKPYNRVELQTRIHNITRLNRYRQLLFERSKFEQLVRLSPDGVLIVDGNGRIYMANPALLQLLGAKEEETLLGLTLSDIVMPEYQNAVAFHLQNAILSHQPFRMEAEWLKVSGETVHVEMIIGHFDWEGTPTAQLVVHDITERKQMENKLKERNEELFKLSRQLVAVQEAERQHLARELHDEVGQSLTGLKLLLDMSKTLPADQAFANLNEAQQLVDTLAEQVRELSLNLRPAMLDKVGLLPVLNWHIQRYQAQTNIRVTFNYEGIDQRFDENLETAAYRIIQEALTNVARHANVSKVNVSIKADPEALYITVADKGRGFNLHDVLATNATGGLFGMQERTRLLGGELNINTAPGKGTTLTAVLPLRTSA